MRWNRVILGAVIFFSLLVVILLFLPRTKRVAQPITQTTTIPSPEVSVLPTPDVPFGINGEDPQQAYDREANLTTIESQPIVKTLPVDQTNWSLSFAGTDGKYYILSATIYHPMGTNPQEAIQKQQPYILDFIRSTGQTPGTYRVTYTSMAI